MPKLSNIYTFNEKQISIIFRIIPTKTLMLMILIWDIISLNFRDFKTEIFAGFNTELSAVERTFLTE